MPERALTFGSVAADYERYRFGYSAGVQWPGTELTASPLFTEVRQVLLERRLTLTDLEYLGYLSTVPAFLILPAGERERALAAVAAVLPPRLDVVADVVVHLARRRSEEDPR